MMTRDTTMTMMSDTMGRGFYELPVQQKQQQQPHWMRIGEQQSTLSQPEVAQNAYTRDD